jgi:Putative prokaryotic signal transducing protein
MLTLLTTARGGTEAALLLARLREAGIPCVRGGAEGIRGTPRAAREIYVDEASLPRAQEILEEDRGDFDEEELARLSEEAGQRWTHEDPPYTQSTADTAADAVDDMVQPATPATGHRVRHTIERLAGRKTDAPRDPFGR